MANRKGYNLDQLLNLYKTYSESISDYNIIMWQFPAAFMTLMGAGLHFMENNHLALFALGIVNFILLHIFGKFTGNQKAIIKATQTIEEELKKTYFTGFKTIKNGEKVVAEAIAEFQHHGIWELKSASLILKTLFIVNLLFLFYVIQSYFAQNGYTLQLVKN